MEFGLVSDVVEIEWIPGREDDYLFRKVAVIRVVEAV